VSGFPVPSRAPAKEPGDAPLDHGAPARVQLTQQVLRDVQAGGLLEHRQPGLGGLLTLPCFPGGRLEGQDPVPQPLELRPGEVTFLRQRCSGPRRRPGLVAPRGLRLREPLAQ
jgi:hypothetical protein